MTTTNTRVRSVLAEPRGHRFSRPGATLNRPTPRPSQRNQHTRPTMPETPQARRERLLRQMEGNPRIAYMLEHGELPHWMHVARQQREKAEREAGQARRAVESPPNPPDTSRGRHRAPRRWKHWPALAVSTTLLLALTTAEEIGQSLFQSAGFPI